MDIRWPLVAAFVLLVIGAGIGRSSVEPEIIEHPPETIEKEVKVEVSGETVYVDRVPDACLEAVRLSNEAYHRTMGALGLITPMTDALALGRAGVAGGNSAWITEADNQLRKLQSKALEYRPTDDIGGNPIAEAMKECEAEIE